MKMDALHFSRSYKQLQGVDSWPSYPAPLNFLALTSFVPFVWSKIMDKRGEAIQGTRWVRADVFLACLLLLFASFLIASRALTVMNTRPVMNTLHTFALFLQPTKFRSRWFWRLHPLRQSLAWIYLDIGSTARVKVKQKPFWRMVVVITFDSGVGFSCLRVIIFWAWSCRAYQAVNIFLLVAVLWLDGLQWAV